MKKNINGQQYEVDKYNPNVWNYRTLVALKVEYVTVDKNLGYKVNPNNTKVLDTKLSALRVLDKEHLSIEQLDGEYKRILQSKLQNMQDDGVTVVDIKSYTDVCAKIAFTTEELMVFGHTVVEEDDGTMYVCKKSIKEMKESKSEG